MNVSALILAGGESRRMGQDKAWLELDGKPLLVRAAATLRQLGLTEILISGRPGADYSVVDLPVLLDRQRGSGPLAGIERALEACASPLLLVLAVDLPYMNSDFLQKLLDRSDATHGVVPGLGGRLEPLAAIYPKSCHRLALECLRLSRLAARDFAESCRREHMVRVYRVPRADRQCFANWNSPSDLSSSPGLD